VLQLQTRIVTIVIPLRLVVRSFEDELKELVCLLEFERGKKEMLYKT
jgi:hypothetical protein